MIWNTEEDVQTREYGEAKALKIQRELRLSSHDLPALARYARQCFEEGKAEERAKGAAVTKLRGVLKTAELELCDAHAWMSMKRLGRAKNIMSNVRRSMRAALICEENV
ncbi:hypothetical protein ACQW08_06255 [Gluconobacter japonicus]|uniref:hypothetical protein n=1 Tax=Gluconobacter japonicus TaxID=376620 RepID=UPI003D282AFC